VNVTERGLVCDWGSATGDWYAFTLALNGEVPELRPHTSYTCHCLAYSYSAGLHKTFLIQ
jgi:hypothetical protein